LIRLGAARACDDAEALVSELATNAVLHARTAYTITVDRIEDLIRVQVHDSSPALPRQRRYGRVATTGRGLRLLASIAASWGVDRDDDGKCVWFELPVEGSASTFTPWDDADDLEGLLAAFDEGPGADASPPHALAA
jgi:hypothetical protein